MKRTTDRTARTTRSSTRPAGNKPSTRPSGAVPTSTRDRSTASSPAITETKSTHATSTRTVTKTGFKYSLTTTAGPSLKVEGRDCENPEAAMPQGVGTEVLDEATGTGRRTDALYTLKTMVAPAKCKRITIVIEAGDDDSFRYALERPDDPRDE